MRRSYQHEYITFQSLNKSVMKKIKIPYKGYLFEIYNRPGIFLKNIDVLSLQKRLVSIATARLGMMPDFSFFKDQKYFDNKIVIICSERKNGEDICFCAMSYLGKYKRKNIIHLGAVYSKNENRGLMQMVYYFGMMYIFVKNWFFKNTFQRLNCTCYPALHANA